MKNFQKLLIKESYEIILDVGSKPTKLLSLTSLSLSETKACEDVDAKSVEALWLSKQRETLGHLIYCSLLNGLSGVHTGLCLLYM